MRFTVVWKPLAEEKLTAIWTTAEDRSAVTAAADGIEDQLRSNPEVRGESRSGATRILVVPPLAVTFEVREDDRIVEVLSVRHLPAHRPGS